MKEAILSEIFRERFGLRLEKKETSALSYWAVKSRLSERSLLGRLEVYWRKHQKIHCTVEPAILITSLCFHNFIVHTLSSVQCCF